MSRKKTDDAEATEDEAKGGGKKKLLIIVAVALLAIGAGAYFFLFSGDDTSEPVAGEVLPLESIAVNLAGGGYLKVGIALQLTEDAASGGHGGAAVDGSRALDLIISTFSQAQPTDVATARDALKESLRHQIIEAYTDHEAGTQMVMDIYFTEYVTQ
ncbi:flagellar basal body-associated FliL family protein [Blastococcus sp. SYSU D00813]